ncbi:MAG: lipoyl domain-containing protein [Chloroflexaceae bacterium]|jgi:pyruvate/2-oxoglutarate dehydrogenase complex dihydrolipoamide acyltransferase (E2) component|nr:lipoyl domain-containing protein [Chloroflexaceae bacterium]
MALVPVYMPKFGATMSEGIISAWHRQEGDTINEGEPLLTVETEKVDAEVEAPASGSIGELCFAAGDEVPVGTIIAYIETN